MTRTEPIRIQSEPFDHSAARRSSAARAVASDRRVSEEVVGAPVSHFLMRSFTRYSRWYLRRHFHSLRVSRQGNAPRAIDLPLVVYSNHASWWDPLVGLILQQEYYPERTLHAPMAAAAMERYGFFKKLGFFPVEPHSPRGAIQFVRQGARILQSPHRLLAVTPQSRFADARERPVLLDGGLGLLAQRVERAWFVPLAMEYVFWEERLPEILVRFGNGRLVGKSMSPGTSREEWTSRFAAELEANQDALAAEVQRRNPEDFQLLLRGGAGQGGGYDWIQALKAAWRGKTFRKEHGHK